MIHLGILGAARIAREAILEPIQEMAEARVSAIASRSSSRAREYEVSFDIHRVYDSYQALIDDPEIDAIYISLPPSEHRDWTVAALEAGKHVLCEKPFALNAGEAAEMRDAADRTGRILMEAFHYRFHPLFERVMTLVRSQQLGEFQRLSAHFNVPVSDEPGEFRYDPSLGGGALMDLGCYPIHWLREVVGRNPQVLTADARIHPSGVDVAVEAALDFGGSLIGNVSASMDPQLPQRLDAELVIYGGTGFLRVENPLAPHHGHQLTVEIDGQRQSEHIAGETTYYYQLRHFLDVIRKRATPLLTPEGSVLQMRTMDAIRNRW